MNLNFDYYDAYDQSVLSMDASELEMNKIKTSELGNCSRIYHLTILQKEIM